MRPYLTIGVLALLGTGCGEVRGVTIDAAPSDVAIEDASPDAPPAPVRITVLSTLADGLPDQTAKVVFQDPQGAVVLDGPVDAMGKAEAMLPDGGSITVIRVVTDTPAQLTSALTTITGVSPGDDITVGRKALATITNQGGQTQMTATFPLTGDATGYQFFHVCGSSFVGTSPVILTFRDSCIGPTFDLIGVATGGTVMPPRFVRLNNINYVGGGSFAIPVGFSSMSNFTVNAQNVPLETSSISMTRSSMIANQASAGQSVSGTVGTGTVTMVASYPPSTGTRSQVQVFFNRTGASNSMRHEMHTPTLANTVDVDLAALALPFLATPTSTMTGTSWSVLAPGGSPDGQVVTWNGRWTDLNRQVSIAWKVIEPASTTGMTLPRLPATYAHLDPQAQTVPVTVLSASIVTTDYDVVTDYDGFRQMAETLVESTFDDKGAFAGMPHQRRWTSMFIPAAQ